MRVLSLAFIAGLAGLVAASPAADVAIEGRQCCSCKTGRGLEERTCAPGCCYGGGDK
jgi:hypothetical protein